MKMKTMKKFLYKVSLLFAAIYMLAGIQAFGQGISDAKSYRKIFPTGTETTVEIENKYGTILIVPWNKDSVQITAEVYLRAKSVSKLRKLRNDVHISFAGTRNYIIARTIIGEGNSKVVSELRALTNTLSSNTAVEINYTVYLPDYINVVLNNKFGDIYIDDLYGSIDISLANGVLKANHFFGPANIELLFATGNIRQLGTATVNMSYGELSLGTSDQLDLITKTSEVDIDTAGIVKLDSRRDKIRINSIEYMFGRSSFSEVNINTFLQEADCLMKYGILNIEQVNSEFDRIDLTSEYTDITMNLASDAQYRLDLMYNNKAMIYLPESGAVYTSRSIGDDMMATEGFVGDESAAGQISIRADDKCFIKISTRQ